MKTTKSFVEEELERERRMQNGYEPRVAAIAKSAVRTANSFQQAVYSNALSHAVELSGVEAAKYIEELKRRQRYGL